MKKLLIAIILLTPFSSPAIAGSDLQEATDDVCKCMEAPNKKATEALALIKQAQASGDMSQIVNAQGSMMGVIKSSSKCFEALPSKYPDINKSEELKNKVMSMAEKQCPNPMAKMSRN